METAPSTGGHGAGGLPPRERDRLPIAVWGAARGNGGCVLVIGLVLLLFSATSLLRLLLGQVEEVGILGPVAFGLGCVLRGRHSIRQQLAARRQRPLSDYRRAPARVLDRWQRRDRDNVYHMVAYEFVWEHPDGTQGQVRLRELVDLGTYARLAHDPAPVVTYLPQASNDATIVALTLDGA